MYTHDDFATDVVRHFQFLETDYGMRREPLQKAGVSVWVTYANPTVKVVIENETGGFCGVSVQNLRHVKKDPLERSEFDLDEIIAVSGSRPPRRQDAHSVSEAIARAAETLRAIGAPVLNGDFEALHERQRKAADAIRRHHPGAPHPDGRTDERPPAGRHGRR
jgi:hypothetical protein